MFTMLRRLAGVRAKRGADRDGRQADAVDQGSTRADRPLERLAIWMSDRFGMRGRWAHGTLVSLSLHLVILILAAQWTISGYPQTMLREIQAWASEMPEEPDETELALAIAEPDESERESVFASEAMAVAATTSDDPVVEDLLPPSEIETPQVEVSELAEIQGFTADPVLLERGRAGEEVATVEGAVDRITHEIAANLERGELLVLWLLDASISLVDDREVIAGRLERVFRELQALGNVRPEALHNAVVSFGAQTNFLVPPTADGAEIVRAIREVPIDDSGTENVFGCVLGCLDRYKVVRSREHRNLMLVIWTDESGDDYTLLEDAVHVCQRWAAPAFVVGPSSMFGRQQGKHAYQHPQDGKTYQIDVDRGPDTVRFEWLRLPYWFEGDQFENLRAGVGPYALTRLAVETGGAYFINDNKANRSPFTLDAMRPYLPDYSSAADYLRQVNKSRLRRAILRAVDLTHERKLKGTPQLEFEPTGANFQQQLLEAQQTVAFNLISIEEALAAFGPKGLEQDYEQEKSPRWRAWYDLTLGRLLAIEVRCNEYNWACAEMKGKGVDFVDKQSNRWKFKPSTQIRFGSAAQHQADDARRLLERAVAQNPGTPWAQLAQRELDHPLGFEIEERYVAPPPAPKANPGDPAMMLGRRVEQLRRLQRPAEVKLPKL